MTGDSCSGNRGGPMRCRAIDVKDHLNRTLTEVNRGQLGRIYRQQNECLILNRFIPKEIVDPCLSEVELLRMKIPRNYVPGHKRGGSVSCYSILNEAHESSAIASVSEPHGEGRAAI